MRMPNALYAGTVTAGTVVLLIVSLASLRAQQNIDAGIHVGAADLGGVVTSTHGREAGVWVIAETTDLPTQYAKIVVTDDHGRYLIPDLPNATYSVWSRGYGLVDSPKVRTVPGKILNLAAFVAPNAAAAAQGRRGTWKPARGRGLRSSTSSSVSIRSRGKARQLEASRGQKGGE